MRFVDSIQRDILCCAAQCDRHVDSAARGDPRGVGLGRLSGGEEAAAAARRGGDGGLVGRQRHAGQHRREQSSDTRLKTGVTCVDGVAAAQPLSVTVATPTLMFVPKISVPPPLPLNYKTSLVYSEEHTVKIAFAYF